MRIGYAKVSTTDQNLDLHLDGLKRQKCERIFTDQLGGSKAVRPGLNELKHILQKGDQVIVWKLDRLGRSLRDPADLINYFEDKESWIHEH